MMPAQKNAMIKSPEKPMFIRNHFIRSDPLLPP